MKAGIAGAGIMGQLMAFHLLHAGWEVTVFDKSEPLNCSMAAAGLLTPIAELAQCDAMIYQLGQAALAVHWPDVLHHLPEAIYYKTKGSLLIAHPSDHNDLLRFGEFIISKIPDKNLISRLNQTEIMALESDLTKFHDGFYLHGEGQIDNQHLLQSLANYLLSKGVHWSGNTTVSHLSAQCIRVNSIAHHFDLVIDTRGLGAKDVFNDLRGIRGELVWLHAPDVHITRPVRFLHPRYGLYIVPRPNQIYIIGASEIESESHSPISVQTMLELLTASFAVTSHFKQARILKSLTQCRPVLTHHRPEIKVLEGLIAINGLYRHGFLIAPTIATEVMHWINYGKRGLNYPQLWGQAT